MLRQTEAAGRPSGNRILDAFLRLSPGVRPGLQAVRYPAGRVIYRQDRPVSHVYFPLEGSVGLTINMRDGGVCEATAVGAEGFVGLPVHLGLSFSPYSVVQQTKGRLYRLAAPAFLEAIRRSDELSVLIDRYAAYTLRFAHQTAACNSLHSVRQRACRWLLIVNDRAADDKFELPQAMLADMIGVRRQSISEVAAKLRRDGLIAYTRGRITIVNRRKLESAACCECYGVMNGYYDRLVGRLTVGPSA